MNIALLCLCMVQQFEFFSKNPRSSRLDVFLEKGVLQIYSKFTGEHPCQSVIWVKLQSNFIEIALSHGFCPVNLLHIFRAPFLKNPLDGSFCNSSLFIRVRYDFLGWSVVNAVPLHITSSFLQFSSSEHSVLMRELYSN